jgi:hypothetical protein
MSSATGTAPAREPQAQAKTETPATTQSQPATLKQRVVTLLHHIFQGREDHLGWHQ